MTDSPAITRSTRQTRQSVRTSGGVAVALVASGGALLASSGAATATDAALWTAVSMLVVAGVWTYTARYAAENATRTAQSDTHTTEVSPEDSGNSPHRYTSLGLPTAVTLFRAILVAGVGGVGAVSAVMWVESGTPPVAWAWAAAVGYGVAAALDSLDGTLARRLGRVTVLGSRLDTTVDALGLLLAPLAGVFLGQLPWWYLSAGAARYVFVAGLWWRTRTGRPTYDLPPRSSRRVLAGIQMAFVPFALVPGVADSWVPTLAGVAAGALLLGFARDWLYVSGRLESDSTTRRSRSSRSGES
ncbi:CDP-alcohol phosphatidyltransferase family protein [Haloferax larsenii]|uniref:CDP-alcohol phosphatidyltransferase family protein n=1 Tax=Haloferax larsenii TaxID=302484 RepID=A0ABY5RAF8_HALLR|nr:CDP-alcohol phosphatidyltransferase family protein [Haloferax larsenii]UVE49331.1 CDP-alcohol phosphatidyltransferase family protein [Haloferax larsenii]